MASVVTLKERLASKTGVRIAVIGIGYVGLPLAVRFAKEGFSVVGVDVNNDVIEQLNAGHSTVDGLPAEDISKVLNSGALTLLLVDRKDPSKTDLGMLEALVGVDVFITCVPTPLHPTKGWEPDTKLICKAADMVVQVLRMEVESDQLLDERLVVLESTTYPGTTKERFAAVLEIYQAQGKNCYLAYSPERTSPGPKSYGGAKAQSSCAGEPQKSDAEQEHPIFQITRIVGGIDESSRDMAAALYGAIFSEVRPVESLEAAEMVKLVENSFRFISIGFANEMARIARAFGLNIWDIIDAAKTKPFGLDLCFPGLIGGHCIPIDPHYLGWTVRHRRQVATFIDVAESAHRHIRQDALDLIQRLLRQRDKGLPRTAILFFGIAYKKDVGDIRESAALELMKKLHIYGADVYFWDPMHTAHPVKQRPRMVFFEDESRLLPPTALAGLERSNEKYYAEPKELTGDWEDLRDQILGSKFACVIIAAEHSVFKDTYADLLSSDAGPAIADLRNAIPAWLQTLPDTQRETLRGRLEDRSRYMLLGVH